MGGLAEIIVGDCVEEMRRMPGCSVDAIMTDPPYLLGFMGKDFDKQNGAHTEPRIMQAWHEAWAREALRVLKPGGHMLAFGGTRTHHRLMCAIEDAGFEIRDTISNEGVLRWYHGQGFPKNHDVSKAIDKMMEAEREVVAVGRPKGKSRNVYGDFAEDEYNYTAPATDVAKEWEGWGTALKPAWEPIVVARKLPSEPSVARNVLKHSTGALNIDASRIGSPESDDLRRVRHNAVTLGEHGIYGKGKGVDSGGNTGRWPSNLILSHVPPGPNGEPGCERAGTKKVKSDGAHPKKTGPHDGYRLGDHDIGERREIADPDGFEEVERWVCVDGCPIRELDSQSGASKSGGSPASANNIDKSNQAVYQFGSTVNKSGPHHGGRGGASRFFKCFEPDPGPGFFYCGKSSGAERNRGLGGVPEKPHESRSHYSGLPDLRMKQEQARNPAANNHPTVKPLKLLSYLVRLVTPPGGTVLDPFAGSGSTLVAAIEEGFGCVGIELSEEYAEIARRRAEFARLPDWEKERRERITKLANSRNAYGFKSTDVLRRCPEHGEPIPSGSTLYGCGCAKVWVKAEDLPAREGLEEPQGRLF